MISEVIEMQDPVIDAESYAPKKKTALRMIYHFARVLDSDIAVEGNTEGECLDKAMLERAKQCKPVAVKGEVVE
jgi:hypothetical protein